MPDVYEFLARVLTGHMGVPADLVRADRTLESMKLDSMALVEMSVLIDDECGFPNDLYGKVTGQASLAQVAVWLEEARAVHCQAALGTSA
ncbi:acyl carrier protein [Catenulispora pinisilvae]|uniref:acyl carrier protein n=1 Tax=Catenulispora pinisilvae TaxID=2705253 RepID=UPI0018917D57|nr:acyl carrier protein [Catenulispora pinisilvae]